MKKKALSFLLALSLVVCGVTFPNTPQKVKADEEEEVNIPGFGWKWVSNTNDQGFEQNGTTWDVEYASPKDSDGECIYDNREVFETKWTTTPDADVSWKILNFFGLYTNFNCDVKVQLKNETTGEDRTVWQMSSSSQRRHNTPRYSETFDETFYRSGRFAYDTIHSSYNVVCDEDEPKYSEWFSNNCIKLFKDNNYTCTITLIKNGLLEKDPESRFSSADYVDNDPGSELKCSVGIGPLTFCDKCDFVQYNQQGVVDENYHYCSECGNPENHHFEIEEKAATCTRPAIITKTCKDCGFTKTIERGDAKGHDYEVTVVKEATCEQAGLQRKVCKDCGDVVEETIPATGHDYEVTIEKEATCEEEGIEHHECKNCGDSFDVIIPAIGHDWQLIDKNKDGKDVYKCANCGEVQEVDTEVDGALTFLEADTYCTVTINADATAEDLKVIRIPDTYNGKPVNQIMDGAFTGRPEIEKVYIGNVMSTGTGTFANCENLQYVKIGDGVPGLSESLFSGCTNLKKVHLGNGLHGLSSNLFKDCVNLEEVNIPSGIMSISGSFSNAGTASGGVKIVCDGQNLYSFSEDSCLVKCLDMRNVTTCYNLTGKFKKIMIGERINGLFLTITGGTIPKVECTEGNEFDFRLVGNYDADQVFEVPKRTGMGSAGDFQISGPPLKKIIFNNEKAGQGFIHYAGSVAVDELIFGDNVKSIDGTFNIQARKVVFGKNFDNHFPSYCFYDLRSRIQEVISESSSPIAIGSYAFQDCAYLKTLSFPNAYLDYVDCCAFANTGAAVDFNDIKQDLDLSKCRYIVNGAFYNSKIGYPKDGILDLSGVNINGGVYNFAFNGWAVPEIDEVIFPDNYKELSWNEFAGAQTVFKKFYVPDNCAICRNGSSLRIKNFRWHPTAETMERCNTFNQAGTLLYCLDYGTIENLDIEFPEPFAIYGNDLQGLPNLKKLRLVNVKLFDGYEGHAIQGCSNLTEVYMDHCFIANKTIPSGYFTGNTNLTTVTLGDDIETIGAGVFAYCGTLKKINGCENLKVIEPGAFAGDVSLRSFPFEKTQLTSIDNQAFAGCFSIAGSMKKVKLPKTMVSLNTTAFQGTGIEEIHTGGTTNLYVDSSLSGLSNFKGLYIDKELATLGGGVSDSIDYLYLGENQSVNNLGDCVKPKTVEFSDNVTDVGGFANCSTLEKVIMPSKAESVQANGFAGCANLETVELPNSLVEIGDMAFVNNAKLKSIDIPKTVRTIGDAAFASTGLENFSIKEPAISEDTLDYPLNIGDNAFASCSGLKEAKIPRHALTLGNGVFSGDTALKNVYFNTELNSVGSDCFKDLPNLDKVYTYRYAAFNKQELTSGDSLNPTYFDNCNPSAEVVEVYNIEYNLDNGDEYDSEVVPYDEDVQTKTFDAKKDYLSLIGWGYTDSKYALPKVGVGATVNNIVDEYENDVVLYAKYGAEIPLVIDGDFSTASAVLSADRDGNDVFGRQYEIVAGVPTKLTVMETKSGKAYLTLTADGYSEIFEVEISNETIRSHLYTGLGFELDTPTEGEDDFELAPDPIATPIVRGFRTLSKGVKSLGAVSGPESEESVSTTIVSAEPVSTPSASVEPEIAKTSTTERKDSTVVTETVVTAEPVETTGAVENVEPSITEKPHVDNVTEEPYIVSVTEKPDSAMSCIRFEPKETAEVVNSAKPVEDSLASSGSSISTEKQTSTQTDANNAVSVSTDGFFKITCDDESSCSSGLKLVIKKGKKKALNKVLQKYFGKGSVLKGVTFKVTKGKKKIKITKNYKVIAKKRGKAIVMITKGEQKKRLVVIVK